MLQVSLWLVDVCLSCNEVEAVASLHNMPDAWWSSLHAHDSRPEQGKTEVRADPAQCGWIGLSSLLRQERSQSLVERGCQVPHSGWDGEDQGRKWAMLHFNDALLIFSFLGIFLTSEAWLEGWLSVGLRVWVKNLVIKKMRTDGSRPRILESYDASYCRPHWQVGSMIPNPYFCRGVPAVAVLRLLQSSCL